MLHACFQLLKDCVEKEGLLNDDVVTVVGDDEKNKNLKSELLTLYEWWIERVEKDNTLDGQYDKDNEMLIRLIKIRRFLWM